MSFTLDHIPSMAVGSGVVVSANTVESIVLICWLLLKCNRINSGSLLLKNSVLLSLCLPI